MKKLRIRKTTRLILILSLVIGLGYLSGGLFKSEPVTADTAEQRIVFTGNSSTGGVSGVDLYIMGRQSKQVTRLTNTPDTQELTGGIWSPVGDKILFDIVKDSKPGLATISPDGTAYNIVTDSLPAGRTYAGSKAWSSDGKKIYLVTTDYNGTTNNNKVYSVDVNGANLDEVISINAGTNNTIVGTTVDANSLGTKLVVSVIEKNAVTDQHVTSEIRSYNVDGSGMQKLTEVGSDKSLTHPVWSPDGKKVLYVLQIRGVTIPAGYNDLTGNSDKAQIRVLNIETNIDALVDDYSIFNLTDARVWGEKSDQVVYWKDMAKSDYTQHSIGLASTISGTNKALYPQTWTQSMLIDSDTKTLTSIYDNTKNDWDISVIDNSDGTLEKITESPDFRETYPDIFPRTIGPIDSDTDAIVTPVANKPTAPKTGLSSVMILGIVVGLFGLMSACAFGLRSIIIRKVGKTAH